MTRTRADRSTTSGRTPKPLYPGAVVLASFVVATVWWPLVLVGIVLVVVLHIGRPIMTERERRRRSVDVLADVTDLILIAVSSGETIGGAVRVVAIDGPTAVRHGFEVVIDHLRAGGNLNDGLQLAVDALGPSYRPLLTALAQAEREGSPLSSLLARLADEASSARRRRAELAARQLPVQMLVPLVCCSLPAVVLGAVVPLLIVSLRRL